MQRLLRLIQDLYEHLRFEKRVKWHRDLPFDEMLFDRWQRAKNLGFGDKTSIYHNAYVYGDVRVGSNTWIGPFVILDGSGKLEIGNNCSISAGVQIYTHDTVKWALSGGIAPYEYGCVKIGNNCYVGPNTIISRGITIGDCTIIGANSYVDNDIPSHSVAFGTPCRVKRQVILSDMSIALDKPSSDAI